MYSNKPKKTSGTSTGQSTKNNQKYGWSCAKDLLFHWSPPSLQSTPRSAIKKLRDMPASLSLYTKDLQVRARKSDLETVGSTR
jgi:hypothetical protein